MKAASVTILATVLCVGIAAIATSAYSQHIAPTLRQLIQTHAPFQLPLTNPDELASAVVLMDQQRRFIASLYPPEEARVVFSSLYPMRFLAALSHSEIARHTFSERPSLYTFGLYVIALERTMAAHEFDSLSLAHTIATQASDARFGFLVGTVTTESMSAGLRAVAIQTHAQRRSWHSLIWCTLTQSADCPSAAREPRTLSASVSRPHTSAYDDVLLLAQPDDFSLPQVTINTACYPQEHVTLTNWVRTFADGTRYRKSSPSGDLYAIDYRRMWQPPTQKKGGTPDVSHGFNEWLQAQGVTFLFQPLGNFYRCAQVGDDVARIGSLLGMHFLAQKPPATLSVSHATDVQEFASKSILDEMTAEKFAKSMSVLSTNETAPTEVRAWAQEVSNAHMFGTWRTDEILRAAVIDNSFLALAIQKGERIPLSALLLARTFPSVVFMTSNPSISPSPVDFRATMEAHDLANFRLTTLDALMKSGLPRSATLEALQYGSSIVNPAIETVTDSLLQKNN